MVARVEYEVALVQGRTVLRRKFESLAHGRAFEAALKARYGAQRVVGFRTNDPQPPPRGWRARRRGELWCPFCEGGRLFRHDQRLGIDKCPVCGISTRHWHVRKHNGLWT